ncbi:MAG: hypothetical protein DMF08_08435 [Verrucomicrobia bacterium]|nr:MAG: hypothetical protein DMF08_08435 [Verrucomicrobiota bacterium]
MPGNSCYEASARCSLSLQRRDFGFDRAGGDQQKLRSIGEMTELSIDTKNKRICLRLELLGETEPVDVDILRYSLKRERRYDLHDR